MIETLANLPSNVVGFKAKGVVDTALENFTSAAWIRDAWLGLREIAGHFIPGEYKGFTTDHLADAVEWAAKA